MPVMPYAKHYDHEKPVSSLDPCCWQEHEYRV